MNAKQSSKTIYMPEIKFWQFRRSKDLYQQHVSRYNLSDHEYIDQLVLHMEKSIEYEMENKGN